MELERRLRVIKDRRIASRRKVRRFRQAFLFAEGRAEAQGKCLAEQLDNDASSAYQEEWQGEPVEFGSELLQLAAQTPSRLDVVVGESALEEGWLEPVSSVV